VPPAAKNAELDPNPKKTVVAVEMQYILNIVIVCVALIIQHVMRMRHIFI
jgi:hypothetical protein